MIVHALTITDRKDMAVFPFGSSPYKMDYIITTDTFLGMDPVHPTGLEVPSP